MNITITYYKTSEIERFQCKSVQANYDFYYFLDEKKKIIKSIDRNDIYIISIKE